MPFRLSVRQKLIAIVILVCVGYAAFGAYSVLKLNQMSATSNDASKLSQLTNDVKNLEISLLKLERQTSQLSQRNVPLVQAGINAIRTSLKQDFQVSRALIDAKGQQQLSDSLAQIPTYLDTLNTFITTQTQFGLTSNSGAIGKLNTQAKALADKLSMLESFAAQFKEVRNREKDFLAYNDEAHQTVLNKAIKTLKSGIDNLGFGDVFNPLIEDYEAALQPVIQLSFAIQKQQKELNIHSQNNIQSMDDTTEYLQHTLLANAETLSRKTADQARQSVIIGCLILAIVIGFILSGVIRSLNRNLTSVLKVLNDVAQGRLKKQDLSNTANQDEFQQLLQASNKMSDGLRDLVQHLLISNQALSDTADELDESVRTITSGSERIRDRSNTLAASTEEISATADNVQSMTQAVQDSSQTVYSSAQEGVRAMQAAMHSISDVAITINDTHKRVDHLGDRSKEIDLVIDLIIDVANQTSLLALNAAIEAARAGEAGRGFAVVADEVKALADQTVKASSDITSKIEGIQQDTQAVVQAMSLSLSKVEESKVLSQNAVQTIHQVEQHSQDAIRHTEEITQSIKEVAITTAQMAHDMDQIAHDIEENHLATESINASSAGVHSQSNELKRQIHRFELN